MDFGFGFNPNLHNFNFMTNIPFLKKIGNHFLILERQNLIFLQRYSSANFFFKSTKIREKKIFLNINFY
jgi:hypothetical protein